MIDWTAIASLAAVATVVVAIFQLRSSKKRPSLTAVIPSVISIESYPAKVTKVTVFIEKGSVNLSEFDFLKTLYSHERGNDFINLSVFLQHMHFGIIILKNESKNTARRLHGEIRMNGIRSCKVESTQKLGKAAIELTQLENALQIAIAEMPAGEIVKISCVGDNSLGWTVEPLNSAVDFERKVNV
jgi:hypothetical protein